MGTAGGVRDRRRYCGNVTNGEQGAGFGEWRRYTRCSWTVDFARGHGERDSWSVEGDGDGRGVGLLGGSRAAVLRPAMLATAVGVGSSASGEFRDATFVWGCVSGLIGYDY